MTGLMEPQRPDDERGQREDPLRPGCDHCRWEDWEVGVWTATACLAFILILVIFSNLGSPTP